ncbi:hypothetical protein HS088_TW04G00671 [Tripterygium wilfordii]|uniref:Uncharacterized protein n=1 Tax=Tripterygium wilfordii TaxID=458696 RepID=A0A7J7DQZ7_TRIWF|nr:uncharacterized protein LOC119996818 [Tripterygium wilfordii]KAF5748690.1 hypothetical protein HS088_TW04G00648 [Tripterygium wilfordii]KAF5748713.1 hypothetical protein HS088_TW04G00671 [Tripterygium wilfordii]
MESPAGSTNRKGRGFVKGKLMQMPFYRAAKQPSSTTTTSVQYSSKVYKPTQTSPSTGYVDYVIAPSPKHQKVAFINIINPENTKQFEALFGVAADEAVDIKATTYISAVQERFRLEGINHA